MSSSEERLTRPRLHAFASSATTRIRVTDAGFQPVALPDNAGEVDVALAPGIYEVAFVDAEATERHLVALRPDATGPVEVTQSPDVGPTHAPRSGGGVTSLPVDEPDPGAPGGVHWPTSPTSPEDLLVVVHDESEADVPQPPGIRQAGIDGLAEGLSLVSADGATVIPGNPVPGEAWAGAGAGVHFPLAAGLWRLRLATGAHDQLLETPVVVCPGWTTTLHFPAVSYGSRGHRRADVVRAQVRMVPPGPRPEEVDRRSRRLEANALRALAEGRELRGHRFDEMLRGLLTAEFEYPMLGLYAGYLVARRLVERRRTEDVGLLADVVRHLEEVTQGGPHRQLEPPLDFRHPDVAVLQLRLALAGAIPVEEVAPFSFPPTLMLGWRALLQAARTHPWLVPSGSLTDHLADRIVGAGPSLAWSLPPESPRSGHAGRRALAADRVLGGNGAYSAPARSFARACALIDVALHHADLREWFRIADAPPSRRARTTADRLVGDAPAVRALEPAQRMLAQALHPVAAGEAEQAELATSGRAATVVAAAPTSEVGPLVESLGLPPATIERAALGLAAALVETAQRVGIDLEARTPMARPELILPYEPGFLGDGFEVPLPSLGDALQAAALRGGEVIDYTHFSLVMHVPRRVAVYTAHNVDAAQMVRVSDRHLWQMDERIGEFQLGPEVYEDNQLDRGHLVRRGDVLWGSPGTARAANRATFFYSNAAPQHQNFNQDEWVALEDWVLHQATDFSYRLCVFTGPVLRDDDPLLGDLPPGLRVAFRARGPAQIPAAFWKVVVLRDGSAGGEDLAAVAFAMRQSEMWGDREGKRLLHLKVHQVTLEAIEGWTGLDFGRLKQVDELAWSEERARLRDAGTEPAWPTISDASDVVFTGQFRRQRGLRAQRGGTRGAQPRPAGDVRREAGGCGCADGGGFDARAAIAALGQDLARLTDAVASQAGQAVPAGGPRAALTATPDDDDALPLPPEAEQRITATVDAAPEALKARARRFARRAAEQAEIARGRVTAPTPAEVTRIVGGDLVPPGGFPECCCIGDATGWFCTGVLVAPQVVLTAAHCGAQITRVLLKGNNVRQVGSDSLVVPVRQAVVHPGYRAHPWNENDLNVLVLARPAGVAPVPIATAEQLQQATEVRLVGFGYNDPVRPEGFGQKRQVTVDLGFLRVAPEATDLGRLEQLHGFHADYEFTAGRKGLGRDTCNGDSGGPAYLTVGADGSRAVAGLTSRATRDATVNCGDGGIYVRPDRFRDWINSILQSAGLSPLAP